MPGAQAAPAASRAKGKSTQAKSPQVRRSSRHSLRNGFTAYSALSLVSRALLPPSPARSSHAGLISASGYQDHAASPYAIRRTRLMHRKRPSHSAPNTRDDREAPLLIGYGMRKEVPVICPPSQAKVPATIWHDGQITTRAQIAVKRNLLLSRTRCLRVSRAIHPASLKPRGRYDHRSGANWPIVARCEQTQTSILCRITPSADARTCRKNLSKATSWP